MWNKIKKSIVQNNSTTIKNFDYKKGNVNLTFSLRTDIKTDLKDFAELMKIATLEVNEELDNL